MESRSLRTHRPLDRQRRTGRLMRSVTLLVAAAATWLAIAFADPQGAPWPTIICLGVSNVAFIGYGICVERWR